MTTVFDVDHSGHGFIMPVKTGRGVKLICGFRLISTASKPKTKYAFFFPGTAPGATSISYTSGYTFRDLEIGGGGAFGGGFFLKDAFRVNIDNVGMTSVANPIHVAGSTLQLTVSHTIANSDGADFAAFGSSIGWWMTAENYGGLGV